MSMQLFSNNAESKLAAAITDIDTTLTVQTGHGAKFQSPSPGQYELITLEDDAGNREIIQCTSRTTDTLTIVRAQEGSASRAWNAGDKISARITANTLARLAQGMDNSGDARGENSIDLQSTRSDSTQVASGLSSVLIGVESTLSGDYGVGLGCYIYSLSSTGVVIIGNAASTDTASDDAIAIGSNAYVAKNGSNAITIGANSGTGKDATDSLALGAGAYANATGACAIGPASSAGGAESVALGSGSYADGAGSFAFGNNSFASGAGSFSFGANTFAGGEGSISFCHDSSSGGLESIAIGVESSSSGDLSVAIGKGASADSSNSQALGATAQARLGGTTVIAGSIIIPNTSSFVANPVIELAGAKCVIMSDVIDLKATPADVSITIPVGARFYVDEIFLLVTAANTVTAQPTIRFGDNTTMDLLMTATETTGMDAAYKRQKFTPSVGNGLSTLSFGVTIAATATTLQGRFGFVGILIENE